MLRKRREYAGNEVIMANIFSGLESMGLGKMKNMNIFEKKDEEQAKKSKEASKPQITELDLLFDKSYTCPVCSKEFKNKAVKTGKDKLVSADTDLRPKYQIVDSLKYDVVACPSCGYAALNRFFDYMTSAQAKLIKEQISSAFTGMEQEGDMLTYDAAIARYKLALVNTIVKKAKASEKAYTCMKTAWLLRGKGETLPADTADYDKAVAALKAEEDEFILNAYNGFVEAFSKEMFPMCGMDELTATYLTADLARRAKRYDESRRLLSRVLVSKQANERIKNKAREIKDLIMKETGSKE